MGNGADGGGVSIDLEALASQVGPSTIARRDRVEQGDATICIPAYGPAYLTDKCLISVASTCAPACVLLWDNGLEHGNLAEEEPAETRLLDQVLARSEAGRTIAGGTWNLGFAEACNRMAAAAETDLVVFLNCDCETQPGWLEALVRAFDDENVGIAGAQLVGPDGDLRHAGVRVVLGGGVAWANDVTEDLPTRDVGAVTGACMAVRKAVFDEVGGFDTRFWHVFDDVDLCLRVLQAGHRIRYVRESVVMHHLARSPERVERAYHQTKLFQEKWANSVIVGSAPEPVGARKD